MLYSTYRLCHGCRAQFTNRGSEINGVFYCESCSSRRSSLRPVVTTSATSHSVNTPNRTANRAVSNSLMTPRTEKIIVVVFIAFLISCYIISIKSNIKSDCNTVQIETQNQETVQKKVSLPTQQKQVQKQVIEEKPLTQQEIRAAINAYNAGDYKAAIPVLKKAAEKKHAEAAFYYGQALRYARGGLTKDLDAAIENLKIAERGGFVQAANSLGIIYRDSIRGPEGSRTAYEYFSKGAHASTPDPFAVYNYACCHAEGFSCDLDFDEAIKFLQKGINYCYMNQLSYPQSLVNGLREDMVLKLITVMDNAYNFVNIESVTVYLTKGVYRPYDKLYLCTRWLTQNISYDTSKTIRTVESAYKYRKGVCEAYAKCLKRMLNTIDISCEIIDGNWKGNVGHSWNVVWIDRPIYIDVTWAAGYVNSNNVFIKNWDPHWFDTLYDEFKLKHIPG